MPFDLNPAETAGLELLPGKDLADLAVELDLIPEARIDRVALVTELLPRLIELGRREGLPFSKYDAEDLAALPAPHREALARCLGWPPDPAAMVRAGRKVFRMYRSARGGSQVPLMLPVLLGPLARYAYEIHEP